LNELTGGFKLLQFIKTRALYLYVENLRSLYGIRFNLQSNTIVMKSMLYLLILLLLTSCLNKPGTSDEPIVVGIQPFGTFDLNLVDTVCQSLKKSYDFNFVILKSKPLPVNAFVNIKSPRYRADSLLIYLKENMADSLSYIIGLTSKDISTTKTDNNGTIKEPRSKYLDWGVCGLGYRPGPSCIVSTYRLKSNSELFLSRLKKVCTHEIGHNLDLRHCPTIRCVMADAAESVTTIDRIDNKLCDQCQRELW